MFPISSCLTSSSVRDLIKNGFITASKPNAMLYLIIDLLLVLIVFVYVIWLFSMHNCFSN